MGEDGAMARIPYPDPDTLEPATVEFLGRLPDLNIFRMLAGGEGLLAAFGRFGNHLLYKTALDPVLREIAIVRVGVVTGASYELHQHEEISRRLGMSEELLEAVREGPAAPLLDELQAKVVAYTDDLIANVRASDATFDPLRRGADDTRAAGADRDHRLLPRRGAVPGDVRRRHRGTGPDARDHDAHRRYRPAR